MTTPYTVEAAGTAAAFPLVGQFAKTYTGTKDANASDDCSEGCIKAVAAWHQQLSPEEMAIELDLTVLRSAEIGYGNLGVASPAQIQALLAQLDIPSTIIQPASQSDYLYQEWRYLRGGKPLIRLARFSATASTLHYSVVILQTEGGAQMMNPWVPQFVTESYATHWGLAQTAPQYPITLIGIDALPPGF